MEEGKQQRMTARRKFEVFLETRQKDANLGEILRRHGLHVNDLRRIEATVERGATEALKKPHGATGSVAREDPAELATLRRELTQKDQVLAEVMLEYTLLKKSERWGSKAPSTGSTSTGTGVGR
jgi:transposase-like protein